MHSRAACGSHNQPARGRAPVRVNDWQRVQLGHWALISCGCTGLVVASRPAQTRAVALAFGLPAGGNQLIQKPKSNSRGEERIGSKWKQKQARPLGSLYRLVFCWNAAWLTHHRHTALPAEASASDAAPLATTGSQPPTASAFGWKTGFHTFGICTTEGSWKRVFSALVGF